MRLSRQMPHRFTDRWLASVTFGAQWEEFTSLHHAAPDWLAARGVRVSASTLYAMYHSRHRWEGTERATGRNITPLPVHVQICSTSDMVHLNRFM
jgi:hypothetical protein